MLSKYKNRLMRHKRVRAKISGTANIPRASVFRSSRNLFVQLIDDENRKTVFSNTLKKTGVKTKTTKSEKASLIGEEIAKRAKEKGINKIVFDRGGFKYHGRVKALAEGLRKGGLEF